MSPSACPEGEVADVELLAVWTAPRRGSNRRPGTSGPRRIDRALDAGDPRVVLELGEVTVLGGRPWASCDGARSPFLGGSRRPEGSHERRRARIRRWAATSRRAPLASINSSARRSTMTSSACASARRNSRSATGAMFNSPATMTIAALAASAAASTARNRADDSGSDGAANDSGTKTAVRDIWLLASEAQRSKEVRRRHPAPRTSPRMPSAALLVAQYPAVRVV